MYKKILVKPERIDRHTLHQRPFKPASVKAFDKDTVARIAEITGLKEWEVLHEAIELFLHNYCFTFPDVYTTRNLLVEFERSEKNDRKRKAESA